MRSEPAQAAATPTCPRCGYDVSGPIATWTDSCPLEGRCPECGLDFEWRLLLNPELSRAARFVESRDRLRAGDVLVTALKAVRPWHFWRWITIEQPVLVRQSILAMVWILALSGLVVWLVAGVGIMSAEVLHYLSESSSQEIPLSVMLIGFWPWGIFERPDLWVLVSGPFVLLLSMIGLYAVLGKTLGRARVRRVHLVRIGLYQLVLMPVVGAVFWWTTAAGGLLLQHASWRSDWPETLQTLGTLAYLLVPIVWALLWWWCAGVRYLRIQRARLVAVVLWLTALLAELTWILGIAVFVVGR